MIGILFPSNTSTNSVLKIKNLEFLYAVKIKTLFASLQIIMALTVMVPVSYLLLIHFKNLNLKRGNGNNKRNHGMYNECEEEKNRLISIK